MRNQQTSASTSGQNPPAQLQAPTTTERLAEECTGWRGFVGKLKKDTEEVGKRASV